MAKEVKVVKTPEGRVSFPSVFEKTSYDDSKPAYELTLLIPKGTDISALQALAGEIAKEAWGDKVAALKPRNPIRDGDGVKQTGEPFPDEYKGHWFIKAKSYNRPGIVNKIGLEPIVSEEIFYAGCWAKITVTAFAYGGPGTKYTPGVSFWLNNIMKTRDDDPFSGRTSADTDFAEDSEEAPASDVDVKAGESAESVWS
jgi:hypothetical protein